MKRVTQMKMWFASAALLFVLADAGVFASTNQPPSIPPLPTMKSPVDSFRTLLVMPATDRKEHLATRSAEVQKRLVDKIREYQALTPDERELRLKATELRWYLKPLMSSVATNRAAQLKVIPENMREMVGVRIEQWDKIPPGVQQMILTNQNGPSYIANVSPASSLPLPTEIIRASFQKRFDRLFELTPLEKEKILATLSDVERQQMEKTLESFGKLSPMQRKQCVTSFTKFAGMSPAERQEFLRNAQRWSEMSPAERQSWRELVSSAPKLPPFPPITIKRPPVPENPNRPPAALTTNGG